MSWATVAGSAISVAGGLFGGRKAKKRANQERDRQIRAAQEASRLGMVRADEMQALAPQMRDAYAPKYANVNTGYATTNIDPATGNVGYTLAPAWATARDRFMGASADAMNRAPGLFDRGDELMDRGTGLMDRAEGLFGVGDEFIRQAGDFNPQTHAAERFNAAKALYAPGDELAQQGLMQDLFSKGGFGLTLNQPANPSADASGNVVGGQGSVGVNPYLNTFLNARNLRDANLGYGSLREGQDYLDQLLGRGTDMYSAGGGMFNLGGNAFNLGGNAYDMANRQYDMSGNLLNAAGGIEDKGTNALNQAGNWSTMFNQGNIQQQDAYYNQLRAAQDQRYRAQVGPLGAGGAAPVGPDYTNSILGSLGGASGITSLLSRSGLFNTGGGGNNALYQSAYGSYQRQGEG